MRTPNSLRYDRSTPSGRFDSMMRDVPWMFDSIPGWYIEDFYYGLTVVPASVNPDTLGPMSNTRRNHGLCIDPTILPDCKA